MVHGEFWTIKDLFVLPNEYVYWSIQIVMYPFMTGLVAGAFVLSSLYHVFGIKQLKDIARFALVFSFALLPAALVPLLLHLQQPFRGINVLMTPHFTSAIAAFGIVFSTYFAIVASEVWFIYRRHFVTRAVELKKKSGKTLREKLSSAFYRMLTLGAYDLSDKALRTDAKAVKVLAGVGIPVALFLHGYAGFIFGSVKANALWMTPLMPVIFIVSAIVSGIALCLLAYIGAMEFRKFRARRRRVRTGSSAGGEDIGGVEVSVVRITARYLVLFLVLAVSLELLDTVFRGYTAVKSWDVVKSAVYGHEFRQVFVLQYGIGNFLPLVLLLIPRLTVRRAVVSVALVLFGVFMMRWNVVIGGQSFSLTLAGYMRYVLPIVPESWETFKEGLFGALSVLLFPFVLFYFLVKVCPVFAVPGDRPAPVELDG
jgi:Ni/Fe-hydrogenase subunit HybB-like protein